MAAAKPVFNEAGTHVWLYNPMTDAYWECGPEAAEVYTGNAAWDWQYATEAPGENADGLFDESTAEGEAQTGFDPAEHTVEEVNEHLELHAESAPGEVDRVLELERAGKDRKTIVDPRGDDEIA
jgi:hypothetical protein